MGAFRIPPVDNLLRACPVLDVTDNRRLTLWVAFGLTLLGGIGLDHLGRTRRLGRGWIALWVLGGAGLARRGLRRPRARAGDPGSGRRPLSACGRDEGIGCAATIAGGPSARSVRRSSSSRDTTAWRRPSSMLLAALALDARGAVAVPGWIRPVLLGLTLAELGLFGFGLNPAIDRRDHDREPPVIARLREGLPPESGRWASARSCRRTC